MLAYETGVKVAGRFMTVFVRPNSLGMARLGIAATRKIGGSVVRSRAKRVTRELFRHHKPLGSLDLVVVPRREFLNAPYLSLEREFGALLERASRTAPTVRSARPSRTGSPGAARRV